MERLATILGGLESIEYAMVFGSARDGVVRAGSDLDAAVSLADADAKSIDRLLQIVSRVDEAFNLTCDLTVLNAAGPVFRHEALRGRVLFVRPAREDDFSTFYARTCAEYEDLMAWRLSPAETAAQNLQRLQEIGVLRDAGRYAEMVRFRNFIVHGYEQIEPQIVYSLAKGKLNHFRDLVDEIRKACAGETPEERAADK